MRGIPSAVGLTMDDIRSGPSHFVVGILPNGQAVVVDEARTKRQAEFRRRQLLSERVSGITSRTSWIARKGFRNENLPLLSLFAP